MDQRFSLEIRQKLANARVGIAGLGGLGSRIAVILARTGVGTLHLVDFDVVDLTNLNRQQYFLLQLGQEKTKALCQLLRQINPYLTLLSNTSGTRNAEEAVRIARLAREMGAAAVMANTAIAVARLPTCSVWAGCGQTASASSPLTGFLQD